MKYINSEKREPKQDKQYKDKRTSKPNRPKNTSNIDSPFKIFIHYQNQTYP